MKTLFLYIVNEGTAPRLAGISAVDWLIRGAGEIPYRVIEREEDISLPPTEYFAVLTPKTPLVTAQHLLDLLEEIGKRGYKGIEIGEGMLVESAAYREGFRPKRRASDPCFVPCRGAEDRASAERTLYRKIAQECVQNGAIIPDPDSVRIDALSFVGQGAVIEPFTFVYKSQVEEGAQVGSFSQIENSVIGAGATVRHSVVCDSRIGAGTTVGPFAYIRGGSQIGENCRIGDFVEVKKSVFGAGVKAAHLAYVGDAAVGERTNVGCGTVFANYDGREKHKTHVGKGVFIGANSNLVAPLSIGDGAYIAAATTVTEDVPSGSFVIGRTRAAAKERKK